MLKRKYALILVLGVAFKIQFQTLNWMIKNKDSLINISKYIIKTHQLVLAQLFSSGCLDNTIQKVLLFFFLQSYRCSNVIFDIYVYKCLK